jgi:hypothetical protein
MTEGEFDSGAHSVKPVGQMFPQQEASAEVEKAARRHIPPNERSHRYQIILDIKT